MRELDGNDLKDIHRFLDESTQNYVAYGTERRRIYQIQKKIEDILKELKISLDE